MAHKTLIDGTAYEIKGGRDLIGGTGYSKKNGKVPIDGTVYDIPLSKGIPLNTITPGAILMLNESGSPVPFYIAKHDYESGLNGAGRTLLVRKDCYDLRVFGRNNTYANSTLDSWLCSTYLNLLDADIRDTIGTTKFVYNPNMYSSLTTLERAVFQLSCIELGRPEGITKADGAELPIASTLQIAYMNGRANYQWTRTPYPSGTSQTMCLDDKGNALGVSSQYTSCGSRPAFTLPGTLALAQNADGTYSIAA